MNRRSFMKVMMGVGAVSGFRVPLANAADYNGKLFVFIQADGGWDPTSFCDPKTNVAGEPLINNWA
ncbi:MAG: ribulose phosphate epimerase, partial [Acidobacteriia bacterium]|nr:ribulose phosphate epimerase [Terriglobia bacterium]